VRIKTLQRNEQLGTYYAQGKLDGAASYYRRALAIKERLLGPDHPDVATTLNNLALLCKAQGRLAEGETLYRRALAIFERALYPAHLSVVACRQNLRRLLESTRSGWWLVMSYI